MRQRLHGLLILFQYCSREKKSERKGEEHKSRQPRQFPRLLITSGNKDAHEVHEKDEDKEIGSPVMKVAKKTAEWHLRRHIHNALVGAVGGRIIELGHEDARCGKNHEASERHTPQHIRQGVSVFRHVVGKMGDAEPTVYSFPHSFHLI